MACDTFDILPHIPPLFMVSHEGETHKSQVNESQAIKSQTRELITSANQKQNMFATQVLSASFILNRFPLVFALWNPTRSTRFLASSVPTCSPASPVHLITACSHYQA